MDRDFASPYIFSFLESCVARCCLRGESLSPLAEAVDESLLDLQSALDSDTWEVACCREVSHLTTVDSTPLDISGVTVVPLNEPPGGHSREAASVIDSVIAGDASAYARESPGGFAPPQSIIIARGRDSKPFEFAEELSGRIERFLLVSRLLYAGTSQSMYEVQGGTSFVRRFTPRLIQFRGDSSFFSSVRMLRRTTRLVLDDHWRMACLSTIMDEAVRQRLDMVVTSFGMALHKFQLSYHSYAWHEQVVDLATAFEAALSGKDKTDVVLRLKTRAAALLATENDPAQVIFKDVGLLYDLRSALVHGGEVREKDLLKKVRAISTVPEAATVGVELGHAVDRLRGLVRRGLLARLCLASGQTPTWTLGEDEGVDAKLADDLTKQQWRSAWRDILNSFGAVAAADRPRGAVDFISQEDQ